MDDSSHGNRTDKKKEDQKGGPAARSRPCKSPCPNCCCIRREAKHFCEAWKEEVTPVSHRAMWASLN